MTKFLLSFLKPSFFTSIKCLSEWKLNVLIFLWNQDDGMKIFTFLTSFSTGYPDSYLMKIFGSHVMTIKGIEGTIYENFMQENPRTDSIPYG